MVQQSLEISSMVKTDEYFKQQLFIMSSQKYCKQMSRSTELNSMARHYLFGRYRIRSIPWANAIITSGRAWPSGWTRPSSGRCGSWARGRPLAGDSGFAPDILHVLNDSTNRFSQKLRVWKPLRKKYSLTAILKNIAKKTPRILKPDFNKHMKFLVVCENSY